MQSDLPRPEINASKLRVGGEIVGAIFAIGSMLIFLIGIPALRYVFPFAIAAGCLVALVLRVVRHEKPGAPWLLAATEDKTGSPSESRAGKPFRNSTRIAVVQLTAHV